MISFGRKLALFKCRWRPKYFISISELFIGEPNFFNFIHLRHFILFGDHTVFIGGLRMFIVQIYNIFIGDPQIVNGTQTFSLETNPFLLQAPKFSLQTHTFSLKAPKFIGDTQIFMQAPKFIGDTQIVIVGPAYKRSLETHNISLQAHKFSLQYFKFSFYSRPTNFHCRSTNVSWRPKIFRRPSNLYQIQRVFVFTVILQ